METSWHTLRVTNCTEGTESAKNEKKRVNKEKETVEPHGCFWPARNLRGVSYVRMSAESSGYHSAYVTSQYVYCIVFFTRTEFHTYTLSLST